ncbi:MAG: alpha/beta fold hydrolase, partial [Deltaproteobacteria bacterium]|nr:alpha/beta fold hydrolase [Deltaproteobacteria bacterium]
VVLTENKARLIRYSGGSRTQRTPILLLPSMVNRHTIFDLTPNNSVARGLLAAGFDVFLLDWGRPCREDRMVPADEFVAGTIHRAPRAVAVAARADAITLVGYCMGGTLALVYAALHPEKVRNLVLLATPVDFDKLGRLRMLADRESLDVDAVVGALGNPPPKALSYAFGLLVPTWQVRQWHIFFRHAHDDRFYRQFAAVGRWVGDNVEVPAEAFRSFVRDGFQKNSLVNGGWPVAGRAARLGDVRASILNVVAKKDHIILPEASLGLPARVGSRDAEDRVFDCGHVGLSIGAEARPIVWPAIVEWLRARSA